MESGRKNEAENEGAILHLLMQFNIEFIFNKDDGSSLLKNVVLNRCILNVLIV